MGIRNILFKTLEVADNFLHLFLLKSENQCKFPEKLLVLMETCTPGLCAVITPNPIIPASAQGQGHFTLLSFHFPSHSFD